MRWRDIKQNKIPPKKETKLKEKESAFNYASLFSRLKAFITDMFLIMMPIAYFVTYVIMGDKDSFQNSSVARWSLSVVFDLIVVAFWVKTGQTPGYKAYELKVIDNETKKQPSLLRAILRYLLFLISATTIAGVLMGYFRKDKKMLHDILSKTTVISLEK
jgi:uncharacterized RDD family membrane protein YckC